MTIRIKPMTTQYLFLGLLQYIHHSWITNRLEQKYIWVIVYTWAWKIRLVVLLRKSREEFHTETLFFPFLEYRIFLRILLLYSSDCFQRIGEKKKTLFLKLEKYVYNKIIVFRYNSIKSFVKRKKKRKNQVTSIRIDYCNISKQNLHHAI